ncbi:biotin/lipoyl-binding protein [Methylomonas koyamae]|uniref:biotin/lipoyl-binding protein n=1 Tax=Methylomonas koyamae TaxID=702114 RepID=UPI000A51F2FA|nr:biotin/lipoyl-binding protein [Methylomonas koyamae]
MSLRYRWQAYAELWGRYRDTFRYFWRQRRELDSPPRSNDEAEFLPAALALQAQPVSPLGRGVAWLLMALVAATLAWAWFGEVDIIVNAAGKIIPSARTKTIASVDTASVSAIYVREGQFVRQGEPILDLDSSAFDAERDKARANVVEARLQQARAQALIDAIDRGRPPVLVRPAQVAETKYQAALAHLEGQYRDFTAKRQRLDGDIARYASALPLVAQQARDFQALAEAHDVAPHAYLEKEQARIELQGQLDSAKNQRAALIAETRKLASTNTPKPANWPATPNRTPRAPRAMAVCSN